MSFDRKRGSAWTSFNKCPRETNRDKFIVIKDYCRAFYLGELFRIFDYCAAANRTRNRHGVTVMVFPDGLSWQPKHPSYVIYVRVSPRGCLLMVKARS